MENRNQAQLAESLAPLGLREINERMEVAPLLADQGGSMIGGQDWVCCTCKVTPDVLEKETSLVEILDTFSMYEGDENWILPG